ncbi:MAG: hypothetical protein OEZ02_04630, partial [Anaerolineae bacterium]|nr:hypothetical protein [Anaerolineae bacterium]
YNLEEVSEARVAAWLTAIKVHGNSGAFDVGLMLQRSDAELFGVSTTIEEMVEVIAVDGQTKKQKQTYSKEEYNKKYPWQAERTEKVGQSLAAAAIMVGFALMRSDPDLDNPAKAFEKVFGNLTININTNNDSQCDNEVTRISCGTGRLSNLPVNLILHELGHILHSRIEKKYEKEVPDDLEDDKEGQAEKNAILSKLRGQFDPYGNLETEEIKYTDEEGNEVLVAGMGVGKRNTEGFREDEDGVKWQWHTEDDYSNADSKGEIFAEMFLNWAFTQTDAEGNIVGDTGFAANKAGQAMYNWMEEHMSNWVTYASEPYGESWFTVEVDEEEVVDEEKEREYRRWKRKIGFSGLF